MFTAHIREKTDGVRQSVGEHAANVAELTRGYLRSAGLAEVGGLVGLLHDAGKLRRVFDDYINGRNDMKRGSIDHSYAGARLMKELAADRSKEIRVAAEGISHAIISHHGICDWLDADGNDVYSRRTSKDEGFDEVRANISELCDEAALGDMLDSAAKEWLAAVGKYLSRDRSEAAQTEASFYIGMLERLIQSALIDADRTDTADFMSARATARERDTDELWRLMDERMDARLAAFSERTDPISRQRMSISDRCAEFAQHRVGACRLIVPTGGGKTLSSLRFAVKQCRRYGLKRIMYIAPFMSILEQNSDVIAELAGAESFLEHHSNMAAELDDSAELEEYQLCAERWDKPVIATTMVQFLNTLFSAKTSSVRRMHRLCDTVIIIDEVQSVPIRCTELFSLAVNFLVRQCNATVVLCSATQPPFNENERYRLVLDKDSDMTGDCSDDIEVFRRTEIIPKLEKYGYSTDEAADFCCERFRENGDLLVIVNTKAQAENMYKRLKERLCGEAYLIHLSTNMCPAHRKRRIGTLRRFLRRGKPVVCVTTQLIEAGVDISFRCVVRALAGMDNAAQAAGRCNRSGEYSRICPVYLINFREENLSRLGEIKSAQDISQHIIANTSGDLLSVEVQSGYFRELFRHYRDELPYRVNDGSAQTSILELLSTDGSRWKIKMETQPFLSQAFKTAGTLFEVIDSSTTSIIVPYDRTARDIIARLESDPPPFETAELLRKAQRYTVSVYAGTELRLHEQGALHMNVLDKRFYSHEYGVTASGAEQEVLIM